MEQMKTELPNLHYVTDVVGRNKMMDATVNLQWNGNTVFVDNAKMKFEKTLPADQQN